MGCEQPRLWTKPLRELTPETSLGFQAIFFIEFVLGMSLLPWQKWWLIHALELLPGSTPKDPRFRFRTILTLVGRQNGKTTLIKALCLWAMYSGRVQLVLGVAQSLDIAKESWQGAVDLAQAIPDLRAEIPKGGVRYANGEQCLRLLSGCRYRIAAATRQAGRGLSVDLLVLDELREQRKFDAWGALSKTTIARPNALTVAITNQGDDESVVLNHLRAAALAAEDETLAIFEWSAPDGCALDDIEAWAQANPGLGYTITMQAIRSAMSTDPEPVFRTEVLCQRVDSLGDVAVSPSSWKAGLNPEMSLKPLSRRLAACVDVALDLTHAALLVAATGEDGRTRIKVRAAWDGPNATDQMRQELPGILKELRPRVFGWFPSGPTAALRVEMEKLGAVGLDAPTTSSACQAFAEGVLNGRVIHNGDPLLTDHVIGAKKYQTGDGWRFVRRGVGHVNAAYAAAGAMHLSRTLPASPSVRFIN